MFFVACRTRSRSCSNENSGVWIPMATNPSFRYACDHARMYGAVRSQLMHVSVQKSTSTTRPRNSAGPSGSELSHPVAPPSDGMRTCVNTVALAKRAEPGAQLGGVQLRLLPGGEVPAAVDLVEVHEVGVGLLRPASRRVDNIVGEVAHGNWNGDVP